MNWNLNDLPIFIAIAETGSISKAAIKLGIQKSSVSRSLARLEDVLDIRLLERNSRFLKLTSDGEQLYNQLTPLLDNIDRVGNEVASQSLVGEINIATTFALSREVFAPKLHLFTQRYPDIQLRMRIVSHRPNLLEEKLDLAIQLGDLKPSGFYAKPLAQLKLLWFCTPEYLAKNPALQNPNSEMLQEHVAFYHVQENFPATLYMTEEDNIQRPIAFHKANQLEDVLLIRDMIANGYGVTLLPEIYCRPLCEQGKLVQIAQNIKVTPDVKIYAVYASKTSQSPRLKAILHFMEELTQQYFSGN